VELIYSLKTGFTGMALLEGWVLTSDPCPDLGERVVVIIIIALKFV